MNDEPLIGRCAEIGPAGVSRVDPVGESGVGGATIDAQVDRIVAALHSYRHRGIHECDIQGSVAAVLAHAGLDLSANASCRCAIGRILWWAARLMARSLLDRHDLRGLSAGALTQDDVA
ncbi:hypothetical protein GAN17_25325 (plasmid) [Mycobacterium kubicae]|uniref:hypothetical protein n=1 Tax=Mycobacterium kubicae TaxID=120959 RepID=UPI00163E6D58|nr:hypothetical protein [Mycobacterium kubicae]QNI09723.1 hypothetical protein GAN17_25325 [Mycobacterium kubicae]